MTQRHTTAVTCNGGVNATYSVLREIIKKQAEICSLFSHFKKKKMYLADNDGLILAEKGFGRLSSSCMPVGGCRVRGGTLGRFQILRPMYVTGTPRPLSKVVFLLLLFFYTYER